jgi:3-hydroxyacyl-[acyl-carrier-protein] dehydratase
MNTVYLRPLLLNQQPSPMALSPSPILSVEPTHPSLPGHFPGNPVVPGVVVLSYILDQVQRSYPAVRVSGVRKLKFLQMLLPDQPFCVELSEPDKHSLRFKCWRAGRVEETGRQLLVDGNLLLAESTAGTGDAA